MILTFSLMMQKELLREFVTLKTTHLSVSLVDPRVEVNKMIDEYEGQICDLYAKIHQLSKCKQTVVVNMPNDSLISKLEFELEKIKRDFKAMDEKNVFLIRVLDNKEKELQNSQMHVDKFLSAKNTLNHLTSLEGNSGTTGHGYSRLRTRTNWHPQGTTCIEEFKRGKYVLAKDMHVYYHYGMNGHKIFNCPTRKKSAKTNKHVKRV